MRQIRGPVLRWPVQQRGDWSEGAYPVSTTDSPPDVQTDTKRTQKPTPHGQMTMDPA